MTKREITRDDVTDAGLHRYCAEASSLFYPMGYRIGEWPKLLPTTMGNGLPFVLTHREIVGDELVGMTYEQANGCISLDVFND